MIRIACVLLMAGVVLGGHYEQPKTSYHQPKTNKCFQCEYRPPKTHSFNVPREEKYDIKVPKYSQECTEHKVPAGHKYVEAEKKEEKHDHGYGGYGQHGYGHHGYAPRTYGTYEPTYKTVKRCVPKVEYATETRSRTVYDTETKTGPAGGFTPCMGPITEESGKADGVDAWDCHSSCFTRVDHHGNVARGCFKGEFGVNPHHPGPQTINGQTYRFCYGSHCNGQKIAH